MTWCGLGGRGAQWQPPSAHCTSWSSRWGEISARKREGFEKSSAYTKVAKWRTIAAAECSAAERAMHILEQQVGCKTLRHLRCREPTKTGPRLAVVVMPAIASAAQIFVLCLMGNGGADAAAAMDRVMHASTRQWLPR